MTLLPEGSIRRSVFEFFDRSLGLVKFWDWRTISSLCGDQVKAEIPCRFCRVVCGFLSRFVETDHCRKNAGKA